MRTKEVREPPGSGEWRAFYAYKGLPTIFPTCTPHIPIAAAKVSYHPLLVIPTGAPKERSGVICSSSTTTDLQDSSLRETRWALFSANRYERPIAQSGGAVHPRVYGVLPAPRKRELSTGVMQRREVHGNAATELKNLS